MFLYSNLKIFLKNDIKVYLKILDFLCELKSI